MIVIVGSPQGRLEDGSVVAAGLAAETAAAAASAGRQVQVVGRIGADVAADAVLQDLARQGVGHVAILRDAAHATPMLGSDAGEGEPPPLALEGPDVELALRYLIDFEVIVVVDGRSAAVIDVSSRAASWGQAALLVAIGADTPTEAIPAMAERLTMDPEASVGSIAEQIARRAVALDLS